MSDPIDMFELAKKLLPGIEENMPSAVREAFEGGKINSIFRTGANVSGVTDARGKAIHPGSFYFRHDDGSSARYGSHGEGWMGDRSSTSGGKHVLTQDDPFYFNKTLFHEPGMEHATIGESADVLKDSKYSSDIAVGKQLFEAKEEAGKITNIHGADVVTDFYSRGGDASFIDDVGRGTRSGRSWNYKNIY